MIVPLCIISASAIVINRFYASVKEAAKKDKKIAKAWEDIVQQRSDCKAIFNLLNLYTLLLVKLIARKINCL